MPRPHKLFGPNVKNALALLAVEPMTSAELAQALGVTPAAARIAVYRLRGHGLVAPIDPDAATCTYDLAANVQHHDASRDVQAVLGHWGAR